jgi:peptidyl-prolyl cis-trans isomerase B (cyclophilin B)
LGRKKWPGRTLRAFPHLDLSPDEWQEPLVKAFLLSLVAMLALGATVARSEDSKPEPNKSVSNNNDEVAVVKTSEGEMVLEFWPDVAPKHVENFKKLARQGFYDGTCFHRVIKGFMIQGGDPNTKDESKQASWGTGGPGYSVNAEFNNKSHTRGVLSMARSADPNSAGSQFFICDGNPSFLDHQYTAFGKLIKGDDVLTKIANTPTNSGDRPAKRINVDSIKIVPRSDIK